MKTTTKTGFERLRGMAAAGVAAAAGLFGAGSARAATFTLGSTVTVSSVGGDTEVQVSWTDIDNNTMSSFDAYTTTGGAVQTMPSESTTSQPTVSAFNINDATFTVSITTTTTTSTSTTTVSSSFTNTYTYTNTNTNTNTRSDAFDGFFAFAIGDNVFTNPDGEIDFTDNTITSDVVENLVPDIDVQVQYHFFEDRLAVRAVFELTNSGDEPVDVPAVVFGNYGSDSSTTIHATSDDDLFAEESDLWYLSSDVTTVGNEPEHEDDPAIVLYRYGKGAKEKPIKLAAPGGGSEDFADQFNLTIKPGQTVRIMMFARLGATHDDALADVQDFTTLAAAKQAGLLEGLSAEEIKTIVNYVGDSDSGSGGTLPMALGGLLALLALRRRKLH